MKFIGWLLLALGFYALAVSNMIPLVQETATYPGLTYIVVVLALFSGTGFMIELAEESKR